MPIRKFRSIEEMKQPRWRAPGDPELIRVMAALWAFAERTRRRRFPAGVQRFRSIEEMDREQQRWADRASK
jgi:hypothetical protein